MARSRASRSGSFGPRPINKGEAELGDGCLRSPRPPGDWYWSREKRRLGGQSIQARFLTAGFGGLTWTGLY